MWPVHLFRYQATQMSKTIIYFEIIKWPVPSFTDEYKKFNYFKILRWPVHH